MPIRCQYAFGIIRLAQFDKFHPWLKFHYMLGHRLVHVGRFVAGDHTTVLRNPLFQFRYCFVKPKFAFCITIIIESITMNITIPQRTNPIKTPAIPASHTFDLRLGFIPYVLFSAITMLLNTFPKVFHHSNRLTTESPRTH